VTELHGVLYRPREFDPARRYPVIMLIYGAPWRASLPKGFLGSLQVSGPGSPFALADLGAVVLYVEPRGTSYRSKAFHDHSYGDLQSGG
ncbi:alpha/beta hydrolase family protein, partial [Klebsiella pneumoniae]|uniref:alpha/beta hydrolase family protein n=1 Tax=Klebsiella pneumoniae TaxID=573 RepID=UPI0030360335